MTAQELSTQVAEDFFVGPAGSIAIATTTFSSTCGARPVAVLRPSGASYVLYPATQIGRFNTARLSTDGRLDLDLQSDCSDYPSVSSFFADGGTQHRLPLRNTNGMRMWSVNGSTALAVEWSFPNPVTSPDRYSIFDSKHPTQRAFGTPLPVVSADGEHIAWSADAGWSLSDLEQTQLVPLTTSANPRLFRVAMSTGHIAVTRNPSTGATGSGELAVGDFSGSAPNPIRNDAWGNFLTFSPDGSRLLYDTGPSTAYGIRVVAMSSSATWSIDGLPAVPSFEWSNTFTWSSFGTRFTLTDWLVTPTRLYVGSVNGGTMRSFPTAFVPAYGFSADDNWLAYTDHAGVAQVVNLTNSATSTLGGSVDWPPTFEAVPGSARLALSQSAVMQVIDAATSLRRTLPGPVVRSTEHAALSRAAFLQPVWVGSTLLYPVNPHVVASVKVFDIAATTAAATGLIAQDAVGVQLVGRQLYFIRKTTAGSHIWSVPVP